MRRAYRADLEQGGVFDGTLRARRAPLRGRP